VLRHARLPVAILEGCPDIIHSNDWSTIPRQRAFETCTRLGGVNFYLSSYGDSQQNHEVAPMEATPLLPTVGASLPLDSGDQGDARLLWGQEKATKNDDADVTVDQWDSKVFSLWGKNEVVLDRAHAFLEKFGLDPLTAIRKGALRRWQRNVYVSLRRFLVTKYSTLWFSPPSSDHEALRREWRSYVEAGRDCLHRAAGATW
jgi:hypothetical protein